MCRLVVLSNRHRPNCTPIQQCTTALATTPLVFVPSLELWVLIACAHILFSRLPVDAGDASASIGKKLSAKSS